MTPDGPLHDESHWVSAPETMSANLLWIVSFQVPSLEASIWSHYCPLTRPSRWQVLLLLRVERVFGLPRFELGLGSKRRFWSWQQWCVNQGRTVFSQLMSSCQIASFAVAWLVTAEMRGHEALLLGSVSVDGLCPTDLSRRSSRHRSVPAIAGRQALPYGFRAE